MLDLWEMIRDGTLPTHPFSFDLCSQQQQKLQQEGEKKWEGEAYAVFLSSSSKEVHPPKQRSSTQHSTEVEMEREEWSNQWPLLLVGNYSCHFYLVFRLVNIWMVQIPNYISEEPVMDGPHLWRSNDQAEENYVWLLPRIWPFFEVMESLESKENRGWPIVCLSLWISLCCGWFLCSTEKFLIFYVYRFFINFHSASTFNVLFFCLNEYLTNI